MKLLQRLFGTKNRHSIKADVIGCNQMPSPYFDLATYLKMQPTNGKHKVYGRIYKGNGSYFDAMNFYPIIGEEQWHYTMTKIYPPRSFMSGDYWNKYDVWWEDGKITTNDLQGAFVVNRLHRWFVAFGYCL